jgi:hypothetical protein
MEKLQEKKYDFIHEHKNIFVFIMVLIALILGA